MEALVCDICGGKLIVGAGGVATCESCGMVHSPERMKEKIQEIHGTVRIDNSHLIQNYLEMANNAIDSSNNSEAESYCNKIIEIDPTNYEAWFIKGKASGWQSTLQKNRVSESVSAFSKAIANAPEEEKQNIVDQSKEQITNLCQAMITLRGNRFVQWPDEEEEKGFISDLSEITDLLIQFIKQSGTIIPLEEMMAPLAVIINKSVVSAFKETIQPAYEGDPDDKDDRPGKAQWEQYINRIGSCASLLGQANELCQGDQEADIERLENIIQLENKAIDSCSWDYDYQNGTKLWHKEWELSKAAIQARKMIIQMSQIKIATLKQELQSKKEAEEKKRFDDYWNEHQEDKETFENEKNELASEIAKHESEKEIVPGTDELKNLKQQLQDLENQKSALGVFKMKEKKELQAKIAEMTMQIWNLRNKVDASIRDIDAAIEPLKKRIDDINKELTKAR
jgi:Chromosome segregation ATPases